MNYTQEFRPSTSYRIFNYKTERTEVLQINSRKGLWVNVTINNKTFDVKVSVITSPKSESILLNNYCPVFSYEKEIRNEFE